MSRLVLRLGLGAWSAKLWWDLFAATFVAHSAGLGGLAAGALVLFGYDLAAKIAMSLAPAVVRRLRTHWLS